MDAFDWRIHFEIKGEACMTQLSETQPVSALFSDEVKRFALPLLLIVFPLAVAILPTVHFLLCSLAAASFLAFHLKCLRAFLMTVGLAFAVNLLVYSGAVGYFDVDAYIAPQIRMIAASTEIVPDGFFRATHLALPRGFTAWCAAWYRLTGSVDCGGMLMLMLLPAAWIVLRAYLTRLQTLILLLSPAAFPSLFCLMSDGCVYLLLLMALVSLRDRENFWLPLLATVAAAVFKTSAWLPAVLVALVLMWYHPRRWWKIALFGIATLLCNLPTLRMVFNGGLSTISADFEQVNADAASMGYFARLAYVYIGHWTTSLSPVFGAHLGGADGGGVDGFGPLFRVAVIASLCLIGIFRKRLKPWAIPLVIAWVSVLAMPTLYIGYARYVPWLYPAVMLPLVLSLPRVSLVMGSAMCVVPLMWLGWRVMLSTETVAVARHATAVHSNLYNIRCAFRPLLVASPQPIQSGSLIYSYEMAAEHFPAVPREWSPDLKQRPVLNKVKDVQAYALKTWTPWMATHFPIYVYDLMCLRIHWLLAPRGSNDEISASNI
jgi:hypothetical protein